MEEAGPQVAWVVQGRNPIQRFWWARSWVVHTRGFFTDPPGDSSSQLFVLTMGNKYIFSRPSDAALPGRHGFVKVDSLLLKIKMMQRLLRPENES